MKSPSRATGESSAWPPGRGSSYTPCYELVDHWQQGEFHHDTVLALRSGGFLVVATNCNGGIKEVLRFDSLPDRWALWHNRCPQNAEFAGALPAIRERAITDHWFDPCALLTPDARSELRVEHRSRMRRRLVQQVIVYTTHA
jgi:hypothetical protein